MVRKIIAFDLDIIENHADYLICYWDALAKSGGTSAELTIAHRKGIPVYLVTDASAARNQRLDAGVFRSACFAPSKT